MKRTYEDSTRNDDDGVGRLAIWITISGVLIYMAMKTEKFAYIPIIIFFIIALFFENGKKRSKRKKAMEAEAASVSKGLMESETILGSEDLADEETMEAEN